MFFQFRLFSIKLKIKRMNRGFGKVFKIVIIEIKIGVHFIQKGIMKKIFIFKFFIDIKISFRIN
ncbi:hypothetical protein BFR40_11585 [Brochothrix thermosphacta]|nr:hypothetical protein BFR40_11585 [Brochothrix thermosphacta]